MSNEVKLCPQCGDEYTLKAVECADCGVPLGFPGELEEAPPPEAFPPTSELACLRIGPIAWTRTLSSALEQVEIRHRVEPDSRSEADGGIDPGEFDGADVFGTWVMPGDLEAAQKIDAVVFAHVIGQEADAPEAAEDEVCPACQSPIAIEALECADCGLQFGLRVRLGAAAESVAAPAERRRCAERASGDLDEMTEDGPWGATAGA